MNKELREELIETASLISRIDPSAPEFARQASMNYVRINMKLLSNRANSGDHRSAVLALKDLKRAVREKYEFVTAPRA